jgi:hypothetical protein
MHHQLPVLRIPQQAGIGHERDAKQDCRCRRQSGEEFSLEDHARNNPVFTVSGPEWAVRKGCLILMQA